MKLQETESDMIQKNKIQHNRMLLSKTQNDMQKNKNDVQKTQNDRQKKKNGAQKIQNNMQKKQNDTIKSISKDTWVSVFSAPAPQRKKEFLEYLGKETVYRADRQREKAQTDDILENPIGMTAFLFTQISYIRKSVYLASLLLLALAVIAADRAGKNSVGVVAAMMPFIALCMVTESARSETYGMAELEMASRFSIKTIMLARFGTIGFEHIILLCVLIPIVGNSAFISYIHAGVYLLVPYLAASVLECAAVRRFRGKEAISACMAISVMISVINTLLRGLLLELFGPRQIIVWILLAVYLTGKTVLEYRKMIYRSEEWII